MKFTRLKFLFFCFLFLQLSCVKDPLIAVEKAYSDYQKAIADKQFGQAASLIDEKSMEYYDYIKTQAMESERQKLGERNFNSKLVALALRQEFSKKQLEAMNNRQILAFAIEHRMTSLDTIENYGIAKIVMEGGFERAVGRMTHKGQLTDNYLKFLKENGAWRINFATIMNKENEENTSVVITGIRDENERALEIVEALSNKPIKPNIWTPANRW